MNVIESLKFDDLSNFANQSSTDVMWFNENVISILKHLMQFIWNTAQKDATTTEISFHFESLFFFLHCLGINRMNRIDFLLFSGYSTWVFPLFVCVCVCVILFISSGGQKFVFRLRKLKKFKRREIPCYTCDVSKMLCSFVLSTND